jgi:predicted Zn-dependent protease
VYEGYFGATGWNGETLASPGLMNTFASPVTVELNDSYAGSYSQHLGTACHELGHALGLDHAPRQSSCMAASAGASTPDATDLNDLELLYRGG